jgi:hypothetical protein
MWGEVIVPFIVQSSVSRFDHLHMLDQSVVPQLQVMKTNTIFQEDGVKSDRKTLVRNSLDQMSEG